MFALQAARRGRTLLVTTDPASSLPAVLDVVVGSEAARVPGAKGLFAASVDAGAAFERWLAPRRELLATIAVRGTYLDEEDIGRLLKLSLPGIDEVIGLIEIVRIVGDSPEPYDDVIVDTAPTGHTLRLLAAPALLGKVAALLDSLQAHHRAVVSALRGAYRSDAADSLIVELDRDGEALAGLLRDRERTEGTWVTLPEPMALEESSDAIPALGSAGIHVQRLIVNRITPPPPQPCEWCEARRRFEARAVTPAARRFAGREIVAMPELAREPHGIPALRQAGLSMAPWVLPGRTAPAARRVRAVLPLESGDRSRADPTAMSVAECAEHEGSRTSPVAAPVKMVLFGGKGGVGKSTCAAAVAVELAGRQRVLL